MTRPLPILAAVAALGVQTGCAGTWDTVTSRKFREKPYDTLFRPGEPLEVMRTSPEGDERAKAMRRLKEPALFGRPDQQDEAVELLTKAATSDPSPVVRVAAIDALGRFQDGRAVEALTAAYHQAGGVVTVPKTSVTPFSDSLMQTSAREAAERFSLTGPAGFPSEVAGLIRGRAVSALADTGRPEAGQLLARVAVGTEEANDRDTRLAAVRGLTRVRTSESVTALAKVLATEKGKDPALAGRAHEGLRDLTGQAHTDDPATWAEVVQAGQFEVVPPANPVVQAVGRLIEN